MKDSVAPKTLEHLFWMAQGTGAWQHFNYFLEKYTTYPLMTNREDTNSIGSLYCMVNKEFIVKTLAKELFTIDLERRIV